MKTIRIKADLYDITWDTPHKWTTLPAQVRVDFKTEYFEEGQFLATAICRDLESRYRVPVKGWERWKIEYEMNDEKTGDENG